MNWTRSDTLALAAAQCVHCRGIGLRSGKRDGSEPCNCVLRAIFRACYARFQQIIMEERHMGRTRLEVMPGGAWMVPEGRREEEYVADFSLVTRRHLSEFEYRIFKYHYLLGADWKLCCRKLKIEKGVFFHSVYRIQQRLGRVFRELKPYGLYPISEYFKPPVSGSIAVVPPEAKVRPIRPPIARRADFNKLPKTA